MATQLNFPETVFIIPYRNYYTKRQDSSIWNNISQIIQTRLYIGRNFNPLFSHQEDIATGVAAATLGFILNAKKDNKKENFIVEQGANLNKPSRIYVAISTLKITIKGEVYLNLIE